MFASRSSLHSMRTVLLRPPATLIAVLLCASCGGGGDNRGAVPVDPEAASASTARFRVTSSSPFMSECNGSPQAGTLYVDAEVEPFLIVNPLSPANAIGIWQQDRWSNGAAQGLVSGASFDSGRTWTRVALPFSRCGGGTGANGGDFARASDPWLAISPDGTAHALALSVTGTLLTAASESAMLVARSEDGGLTWASPVTLIREVGPAANDKGSITADPRDARFVYAVWDRLTDEQHGPTWLARTVDGGRNWEPAQSIYDAGPRSQTIGNQILVLPDGDLVNCFTQIDVSATGAASATLRVINSSDRGATWSGPRTIADLLSIGARDPETGQPIRDGSILGSFAVDVAGNLYAVWQDSRFSSGARDGIAFARSVDGGHTWSAALRINGDPTVQAFVPTVHVRDDGVIGVTYYDLRSNTVNANTLPTDYWLATSADGNDWTETRISETFDLATAPVAGGLFLGDYMGFASVDRDFLVLFVMTNGITAGNRTDVFLAPVASETAAAQPAAAQSRKATVAVSPVTATVLTEAWRERLDRSLRLAMERRLPGWHAFMTRGDR